ncbi:NAD(P)/FAD-dependent oxidoreductase [Streptomyces sp. NPDC002523]
MSPSTKRCVVVGASLGGLRAAESLRKSGFAGEIVIIGDESQPPYNRPPLSKGALSEPAGLERLGLRQPRVVEDVVWRLAERAVVADITARTVTLDNGQELDWDGLVVATGVSPRRLSLPGPTQGRHVVRTLGDVIALRECLGNGTRLVVIGAGFIGCEIAATGRGLGAAVHVVGPEEVPLERPLGGLLGAELRRRHEEQGVRFHLGNVPVRFGGQECVTSVELADGTVLPADVVIEAVGTVPNVAWLAGNGLDLTDGVLCDNHLRVEGHPHVVACGDVARFPNPLYDDVPRRVEHWTMVTDTAKRAGRSLADHLADREPDTSVFQPVPSFWSDQYDVRIQSFGAVGLGDDIRVVEGDLTGDVAVGYHRQGELMGVAMLGLGGRHQHYRTLVSTR